jgi:methionyl-tRNA formyltransferase
MTFEWGNPQTVSVVVDNPSWILPFAKRLIADLNTAGHDAVLCRAHDEIRDGSITFFLGCVKIAPKDALARSRKNLTVHASDLPKGRGFSPATWLTIKGEADIPVCLIEAVEDVDAGPIVFKEHIHFEGHELLTEIQHKLGDMTVRLCDRYMNLQDMPVATAQDGAQSTYRRRVPADSELDPTLPLADQFDLLRTVDSEKYPAFFRHRGHVYKLKIEKMIDGEKQ